MKKLFAIILALAMVLMLSTGCGNTNENDANDASGTGAATNENNSNDAGAVEEAARGSGGSVSDLEFAIDTGNLTLDDINTMDDSDPEESLRAGASWENRELTSVGDQEE